MSRGRKWNNFGLALSIYSRAPTIFPHRVHAACLLLAAERRGTSPLILVLKLALTVSLSLVSLRSMSRGRKWNYFPRGPALYATSHTFDNFAGAALAS